MKKELSKLRLHYHDMREKEETRSIFGINARGHRFSCLFLTDVNPFRLYLTSLGEERLTMEFLINEDFSFSAFLQKSEYEKLVKFLGISFNPLNHFSPADFLLELDSQFPTKFYRRPSYTSVLRVQAGREIEDPDKIYFVGWRISPTGRVSSMNEEKTRRAFGDKMANISKRRGISSCWTADENLEDLTKLNELINPKI